MSVQVENVNRFLATTTGREKLCRLVQYFSRFYAFYLYRSGAPKDVIQRWSDLKQHIGNARKFFRLFKQLEFAQAGIKSLALKDEVLRITGAAKQFAMFFYYCSEALVLANTVNFYKISNAKQVQQFGFKCWFTALAFSIASSLYKYRTLGIRKHMLEKSLKAAEKGSAEKDGLQVEASRLHTEKKALNKQLLQDLVDIIIPTAGLGWIGFDEGIVGLAGMTTSWLAMTSQWQKVASK
ncbi:hypothetical protein VTP01DRAFT_3347 [Rhizomucor pusillus]|uniref:uncharacterized protein n=1 Tax=Rhizomucor pusillus TaxID=4840 RepID=UPI003742B814